MAHAIPRLFGLAAAGLACAALAQPEKPAVDPVDVSQIGSAPDRAPDKLSPPQPGALQVDSAPGREIILPPPADPALERRPVQQLAVGKASAEAAPALSSREQSRPQGKVVLSGEDRCDPAAAERQRRSECARVIETRSAEFDRSPAPLSPEQRLLLEQRIGPSLPGAQNAARRLAGPGAADASLDDQAVAAVALRQPLPPGGRKEDEEDKAALSQEQAAAIVGGILNLPPPPPSGD